MAQYYLSEKGYLRLQEEIEKLDRLIKRDISKEIATAAEHGDLKENAEYQAAKEKQAQAANKLRQLQERFSGANVVRREEIMPREAVTFGKRIKIREVTNGTERECTILGEGETDPDQGIISYKSPLASALIGSSLGDVVDVQLPAGRRKYEILEVDFAEGFED